MPTTAMSTKGIAIKKEKCEGQNIIIASTRKYLSELEIFSRGFFVWRKQRPNIDFQVIGNDNQLLDRRLFTVDAPDR
jgi:hypothetical protein